IRRVFLQGQMRPRVEVISDISLQNPFQMSLSQHNYVIEAFSANTSNKAFRKWVLPRTLRRREHLCDSHSLNPASEMPTVDTPSRSGIRYPGASSGNASMICCAVHA